MYQNPYAPPGFGGYRPSMMQQPAMYQQTITPPQQAIQPPAPVQQSTVQMVTSKAQAEVAQIPFDGQPYFFFDTASRRMYAKSFDPQTGMCPLMEYAPVVEEQPPQYATVAMMQELEGRLTAMLQQSEEPKRIRQKKEAETE